MSKIGVKKILSLMLIKEFPVIEEINVETVNEDFLEPNDERDFIINVGIPPGIMKYNELENIRETAKTLSQFVVGHKERVTSVRFYNPHAKKF